VVAQHLADTGEAARTASALYSGVLLLMGVAFGALFVWVTHIGRLPSPKALRAARLRFMIGEAVYAAAVALSWVSARLALALCGAMARYYAFDPGIDARCRGSRQSSDGQPDEE
jgi:hypothetical protein